MKNLILVSIIGAFLFFAPSQSFAQTQGQEKREEAKEHQNKAQEKREEAKEHQDKAREKRGEAKEHQEMARDKREEAKEHQDMAKDKREEAKEQDRAQDKADRETQGNAYGRDKGDMSGREFGQHRAMMARNKAEDARTRLSETESFMTVHSARLNSLKQSLEEEAKMPRADKQEIEERKIRVSRAEKKLSQLEQLLNESRERLRKTERSLEAVIDNE